MVYCRLFIVVIVLVSLIWGVEDEVNLLAQTANSSLKKSGITAKKSSNLISKKLPDTPKKYYGDLESQYMPYGLIAFNVYPGYRVIDLDRENIIGFSENIVVRAGNHWVEITSPQGYADTSFKVEVGSGESVKMVVQLRNVLTGKLAPLPQTVVKKDRTKLLWTVMKASTITVGLVTGYLAYQEESKTANAQKLYESYSAGTEEAQFTAKYNEAKEHAGTRSGMLVLSGVSFIIGALLVAFK